MWRFVGFTRKVRPMTQKIYFRRQTLRQTLWRHCLFMGTQVDRKYPWSGPHKGPWDSGLRVKQYVYVFFLSLEINDWEREINAIISISLDFAKPVSYIQTFLFEFEMYRFTWPSCPIARNKSTLPTYTEHQRNQTTMFKSFSIQFVFSSFSVWIFYIWFDFHKTISQPLWMIPHFTITCIWVHNAAGY